MARILEYTIKQEEVLKKEQRKEEEVKRWLYRLIGEVEREEQLKHQPTLQERQVEITRQHHQQQNERLALWQREQSNQQGVVAPSSYGVGGAGSYNNSHVRGRGPGSVPQHGDAAIASARAAGREQQRQKQQDHHNRHQSMVQQWTASTTHTTQQQSQHNPPPAAPAVPLPHHRLNESMPFAMAQPLPAGTNPSQWPSATAQGMVGLDGRITSARVPGQGVVSHNPHNQLSVEFCEQQGSWPRGDGRPVWHGSAAALSQQLYGGHGPQPQNGNSAAQQHNNNSGGLPHMTNHARARMEQRGLLSPGSQASMLYTAVHGAMASAGGFTARELASAQGVFDSSSTQVPFGQFSAASAHLQRSHSFSGSNGGIGSNDYDRHSCGGLDGLEMGSGHHTMVSAWGGGGGGGAGCNWETFDGSQQQQQASQNLQLSEYETRPEGGGRGGSGGGGGGGRGRGRGRGGGGGSSESGRPRGAKKGTQEALTHGREGNRDQYHSHTSYGPSDEEVALRRSEFWLSDAPEAVKLVEQDVAQVLDALVFKMEDCEAKEVCSISGSSTQQAASAPPSHHYHNSPLSSLTTHTISHSPLTPTHPHPSHHFPHSPHSQLKEERKRQHAEQREREKVERQREKEQRLLQMAGLREAEKQQNALRRQAEKKERDAVRERGQHTHTQPRARKKHTFSPYPPLTHHTFPPALSLSSSLSPLLHRIVTYFTP